MYEGTTAGIGLHYNTKFLDPMELTSYWDLLKPNWKGKIPIFEQRGVGTGARNTA
jgi:ABC-type Fe3+ transport system substrate-binding protein